MRETVEGGANLSIAQCLDNLKSYITRTDFGWVFFYCKIQFFFYKEVEKN